MEKLIAFTVDIDWAPEPVIEDTLNIFEKFKTPCTLFATHESAVLQNVDRTQFEIGVHPNFNHLIDGKGGSAEQVIDSLLDIYPEAKGVRSHSMLQSSRVLSCFANKKFVYEANHFLPYWKNIYPFRLWNGLIRIPYNWEDDIHWSYGRNFQDCGLDLNENGLFVFDFHPIHVFLNTESEERYRRAYSSYHSFSDLKEYRNLGPVPGTRDLLISLLQKFQESELHPTKVIDIAMKLDNSL